MYKKTLIILLTALLIVSILSGCGSSSFSSVIQEALDPTTATEMPITVSFTIEGDTEDFDGLYTGDLQNGVAHGRGVFEIYQGEDLALSYKGEFSDGIVNGDGVLRLIMDDSEMKYEGTFVDGALNGYSSVMITGDGETYTYSGTFTKGEFTPTTGEKYDYLGKLDLYGIFTLPGNVITYIDSHPEYFPVADKPDVEAAVLRDFEYRQFTKTRKQETIGLIKLELIAAQVYEDAFDEDTNEMVTYLLGADKDENLYTLFYLDTAEIYDGDIFTVYALPVATTSYENVSGGITNAIVLVGSYIEKQ